MGAIVSLLLCEYKSKRMLCYASSDHTGATLSAGLIGDWTTMGFKRSQGSPFDWIKVVHSATGIRFFPKAYWRGTPVGIAGWCVHTPDARVHCEVMSNEINQEAWFGRRYKSSLEWAPLARAIGWDYDFHDMIAARYCTIDELELVEGPPPEGPF